MDKLSYKQSVKKQPYNKFLLIIITSFTMLLIGIVATFVLTAYTISHNSSIFSHSTLSEPVPEIIDSIGTKQVKSMLLTPNPYSRPQAPLSSVNSIVIHYTANPGTDAKANRNYFENLKTRQTTYSSSHFLIGLDGEIIQCIPLNEISFASNSRNSDTISIECCHPDNTGVFTEKTYDSLVALTAWLCNKYDISDKEILRHYDVSGKKCPLYFVNKEEEWLAFKETVINEAAILKTKEESKLINEKQKVDK